MSLDFENLFVKPVIYGYSVSNEVIRRVQPIAVNGRDFVDVWLQSKWAEAADWSAADNLDELKKAHDNFEALRNRNTTDWPTFAFGAVRSCAGEQNRFQVELDQDSGAPKYFAIAQGTNAFTMLTTSSQPDPRCRSGDLMGKH
jgi:hypothetical protein